MSYAGRVFMLLAILVTASLPPAAVAESPVVREQQCWILLGGLQKREILIRIQVGFSLSIVDVGPRWADLSQQERQRIDALVHCVLVHGERRRAEALYRDSTGREVGRGGATGFYTTPP